MIVEKIKLKTIQNPRKTTGAPDVIGSIAIEAINNKGSNIPLETLPLAVAGPYLLEEGSNKATSSDEHGPSLSTDDGLELFENFVDGPGFNANEIGTEEAKVKAYELPEEPKMSDWVKYYNSRNVEKEVTKLYELSEEEVNLFCEDLDDQIECGLREKIRRSKAGVRLAAVANASGVLTVENEALSIDDSDIEGRDWLQHANGLEVSESMSKRVELNKALIDVAGSTLALSEIKNFDESQLLELRIALQSTSQNLESSPISLDDAQVDRVLGFIDFAQQSINAAIDEEGQVDNLLLLDIAKEIAVNKMSEANAIHGEIEGALDDIQMLNQLIVNGNLGNSPDLIRDLFRAVEFEVQGELNETSVDFEESTRVVAEVGSVDGELINRLELFENLSPDQLLDVCQNFYAQRYRSIGVDGLIEDDFEEIQHSNGNVNILLQTAPNSLRIALAEFVREQQRTNKQLTAEQFQEELLDKIISLKHRATEEGRLTELSEAAPLSDESVDGVARLQESNGFLGRLKRGYDKFVESKHGKTAVRAARLATVLASVGGTFVALEAAGDEIGASFAIPDVGDGDLNELGFAVNESVDQDGNAEVANTDIESSNELGTELAMADNEDLEITGIPHESRNIHSAKQVNDTSEAETEFSAEFGDDNSSRNGLGEESIDDISVNQDEDITPDPECDEIEILEQETAIPVEDLVEDEEPIVIGGEDGVSTLGEALVKMGLTNEQIWGANSEGGEHGVADYLAEFGSATVTDDGVDYTVFITGPNGQVIATGEKGTPAGSEIRMLPTEQFSDYYPDNVSEFGWNVSLVTESINTENFEEIEPGVFEISVDEFGGLLDGVLNEMLDGRMGDVYPDSTVILDINEAGVANIRVIGDPNDSGFDDLEYSFKIIGPDGKTVGNVRAIPPNSKVVLVDDPSKLPDKDGSGLTQDSLAADIVQIFDDEYNNQLNLNEDSGGQIIINQTDTVENNDQVGTESSIQGNLDSETNRVLGDDSLGQSEVIEGIIEENSIYVETPIPSATPTSTSTPVSSEDSVDGVAVGTGEIELEQTPTQTPTSTPTPEPTVISETSGLDDGQAVVTEFGATSPPSSNLGVIGAGVLSALTAGLINLRMRYKGNNSTKIVTTESENDYIYMDWDPDADPEPDVEIYSAWGLGMREAWKVLGWIAGGVTHGLRVRMSQNADFAASSGEITEAVINIGLAGGAAQREVSTVKDDVGLVNEAEIRDQATNGSSVGGHTLVPAVIAQTKSNGDGNLLETTVISNGTARSKLQTVIVEESDGVIEDLPKEVMWKNGSDNYRMYFAVNLSDGMDTGAITELLRSEGYVNQAEQITHLLQELGNNGYNGKRVLIAREVNGRCNVVEEVKGLGRVFSPFSKYRIIG